MKGRTGGDQGGLLVHGLRLAGKVLKLLLVKRMQRVPVLPDLLLNKVLVFLQMMMMMMQREKKKKK